MAIIISKREDMVSFLNHSVEHAQNYKPELAAVPFALVETVDEANALLLDIKCFDPRVDGETLPYDAVGKVRVSGTQTVNDALDALESLTMVDVGTLDAALRCITHTHVKGKTRKIKVKMFGELIIDLEQYGKLSGLPLTSPEKVEYAVFLREVTDKKTAGKKIMFVMVKGTTDVTNGNGGDPEALKSMMARLEARTKFGGEPGAKFNATGLDSGWRLFNNPRFNELLSWWKRGYSYSVSSNENEGLDINY